jgi:hypothetical protein
MALLHEQIPGEPTAFPQIDAPNRHSSGMQCGIRALLASHFVSGSQQVANEQRDFARLRFPWAPSLIYVCWQSSRAGSGVVQDLMGRQGIVHDGPTGSIPAP